MTFEDYQHEAVKFRTATANNEEYLVLGLIEEVGEAAGKLAKRRRDGVFDKQAFVKELGDILWFVANYADYSDCEDETNYSVHLSDCFEKTFNALCTEEEIMKDLAIAATGWVEGFDSAGNVIYGLSCLAKGRATRSSRLQKSTSQSCAIEPQEEKFTATATKGKGAEYGRKFCCFCGQD